MANQFLKLTDFPVADSDATYYFKTDGTGADDIYILLATGVLQVLAIVDGESSVEVTADDRVQARVEDEGGNILFIPIADTTIRGQAVQVADMVTCIKIPSPNICSIRARIRR